MGRRAVFLTAQTEVDGSLHRIFIRNIFSALAFAGVALFSTSATVAQTVHGTLRGVDNVELALEPLDSDARACGIRKTDLIQAVREGVDDASFGLDGYDYALYLRISSLPKETDCFSSIDIEVRYTGNMPLPAYPRGNRVRAVLWSNGTIIISPRNHHGREVANVVTYLVKGLAADWSKDNSVHQAG